MNMLDAVSDGKGTIDKLFWYSLPRILIQGLPKVTTFMQQHLQTKIGMKDAFILIGEKLKKVND